MVVPEIISMNILFPFNTNPQSNLQEPPIGILMNMEVNTPRGQPISSSTNISRKSLVYSDMFSIAYANCI